MRIIYGTILAAALALSVHGAESRAEVMDMVHHNPGEPLTRTAFTDPGTLASYGYDAMVVNEFVFPQCAVTFDSFDRRVFPEGSPERAWVMAVRDRMREKCRKCHAAGLKCYYFMDIIVFPKRLVELYRDDVCGPDGRISFSRPLTRKLHRIMLDELFEAVPELDGLVVRTGETYLNNTPYHTGNGPIDYKNAYEESKEIHAELMNLLRDEVCVKRGKRVYYRTWDFGFFHTCPDYYLDVTERVEPHTNLVMAVKHTKGDYLRTFRFNPTLGIGRHRQIVEVQCAREYEGKGAFPNYIGESVIDGFEENAGDAGMKCLAEFAKSPLFAGVWTWSRGGGGQGPYLRNEFWCDMNAYVLSRWARHPEDGEETAFRSFAEKSGIAPESLADFRRLCLLSQKAIIRGRGTMLRCGDALPAYMKEPDNWLFVGWMRDDCLGGIDELRKTMDGLIADGLLDARLGEMAEAVRIWKEIVGLAGGIRASDAAVASYLSTSARYGEILHRIMLHGCTVIFKGYEAEKRGCEPDRALISRAAADYDRAWADFYALKAERPDCASLFRDEYPFYVKRPGHSGATHREGLGDAVRRYADRIFSVRLDVDSTATCECVSAVEGREPSLLPKGRKFSLVWNDEFDGDRMDESKWSYRTNFWGRRAHWFATPEDGAVDVKDGLLHLKLVKRADGQFVSPQLQTGELVWDVPHQENPKGFWPLPKREKPKFMHRYGYYECRCRLQQLPGWWSAFWMQTPMQGCSLDPRRAGIEHDIMESFDPGEIIPHCFHANGYGADYLGFRCPRVKKNEDAIFKLDKTQFHTFGMLWEPDGYTLYIDGRQHGPKVGQGEGEAVSQTEEFILLTTEAKWYRNDHMTGKGVPELEAAAASGDEFLIDYVRVYDIEETK